MTEIRKVIRLDRNGPPGTGMHEMECDPADFQSPLPIQHLHVYFSDEELGLNVGVWDTTTMQEAFGPYPGDEFIWVLEGEFAMIDGDGNAVEVKQGQSACFRNAIPISWKQDGYLKKFFITYLDPKAETPDIASAEGRVQVMDPDAPMVPLETTAPFTIAGPKPVQRENILFTNDAGNMSVGLWDSDAMASEMEPFPVHEFVQMLDGEVTITEEDGSAQTFRAGDCFFVPKGTVCSWEIKKYVKKYFAVLNA
ncbi:cupin domain-containing protein [Thalassovita sp.]|uniref:cupin domain-containing protein n=1 Tax=Thalassovita sp. TaxID=1979401 RepID=UPI002B26E501|nr:cupin domain-containing protein [Thalassovita sp.]